MSLEYLEPVSTEVLESIEGLPDHVLGKNMLILPRILVYLIYRTLKSVNFC